MKTLASEAAFLAAERHLLRANVEKLRPNGVDKAPSPLHSDTVATNLLRTIGDIHVARVADYDREALVRARTHAALWLTLIFWASNYLFLTLGTALSRIEHLAPIAAVRVLTTIGGLGLCYLIHLMLRHRRLSTTKRRLIALACVAPVAAEIYAWGSYFAQAAVDPQLNLDNFTWLSAINTIAFWTWFFLAWAGLYLALMYGFDAQEEQQVSAELREQAHVAQLRALHSQINPHFLFNSLNSVSALILDRNTEKADEMVVKLAHFLRLGMAADPTRKIPLELEVELQRSYLEIEQLRYSDLKVEVHVPEELKGALVPALILQPIVENAVKYGVAGAPPPATISLRAWEDNGQLAIEVVDSGKGSVQKSPGTGIGLANVAERLSLLYGSERSALRPGRQPDGSFKVSVLLPLEVN